MTGGGRDGMTDGIVGMLEKLEYWKRTAARGNGKKASE